MSLDAPPAAPSLSAAIRETLAEGMQRDRRVLLLGEDSLHGGVFGVTVGFAEQFGPGRVLEHRGTESALVARAIGLALRGFRPVVELTHAAFIQASLDVLAGEMSRLRSSSGGRLPLPIVFRLPAAAGTGNAPEGSDCPEAFLASIPGLRVVAAADAREARQLLGAALTQDDPVCLIEPARHYEIATEEPPLPDLPIDRARLRHAGREATLVAWGGAVGTAEEAVREAGRRGLEIGLLDLRSLNPLDEETLLREVRSTGRVVVVHESRRRIGLGAEIAALLAERAIERLEAPILRVAGPGTAMPRIGESNWLPDLGRVMRALEQVVGF